MDKKISELTELLEPSNTDLLAIVNSSETKKIQYGNLGIFPAAGIFGGIHVHGGAAAQAIAAGATYTKLTAFVDDGPANGLTPDAANDRITVITEGYYLLNCSLNFYAGTNNVVFFAAPFVAGVEYDAIHIHRKIATAGDVGSASMSGIIYLDPVPVSIDIRVRHDNIGSIDLTVSYSNLSLVYIGEA